MSARREVAASVVSTSSSAAYALAEDEDFSYRFSRRDGSVYLPDIVVVHEKMGFRSFDSRDLGRLVVKTAPTSSGRTSARRRWPGSSSACCS